jgi:hypothetical protein
MKVAAVERSGNYRISKIWKAEELPRLKTFDAARIAAKLAPVVADEWLAENTRALGANWIYAQGSGTQKLSHCCREFNGKNYDLTLRGHRGSFTVAEFRLDPRFKNSVVGNPCLTLLGCPTVGESNAAIASDSCRAHFGHTGCVRR